MCAVSSRTWCATAIGLLCGALLKYRPSSYSKAPPAAPVKFRLAFNHGDGGVEDNDDDGENDASTTTTTMMTMAKKIIKGTNPFCERICMPTMAIRNKLVFARIILG